MKSLIPLVGRLMAVLAAWAAVTTVRATPAFARQMNAQCTACHTEFPILNEFGRMFKLSGYTLGTDQTKLPPVAFMLQPGFTHTQSALPKDSIPEGFRGNNNFALANASIFYSGRLFGPVAKPLFGEEVGGFLNKFGVFYQHSYDGVEKSWAWDNAELRFADSGSVAGTPVNFGFYLNNNPTMQDPWNTLSAWGYPFNGSPIAPTPSAATLIDGGLSQQVAGLGTYALINNHIYVDVGAYRTLGTGFQRFMGVDPTDQTLVTSPAPYWRVAYTSRNEEGTASWEVGTYGLAAATYPGRDTSAGRDRMLDIGFDAQYQVASGNNDFLLMTSWTHENQSWKASQPLGLATNGRDNLWKANATAYLLHDKTYGFGMQYFVTDGSRDELLNGESASGSPLSDGVILEANWLPLNKRGGPGFWPRSNVKLSLQYILYNRFNGSRHDYDGNGRSAAGNNTLFLGAWLAF